MPPQNVGPQIVTLFQFLLDHTCFRVGEGSANFGGKVDEEEDKS